MKVFFDSSSYAKRFLDEAGSQEVESLCQQADSLGLSILCYPEILSSLNRRLREGSITSEDYRFAKNRLKDELADVEILHITPEVTEQAERLLETNVLRAMDALQIACALKWKPDLFVTADLRQAKAADRAGLSTKTQ
jgi:predicted nucleic acid-binding protein